MNNQELKESPFADTWDATMLSMFWQCPRSFYWFLRGVDYNALNRPAFFSWGSAFQEMLTSWYGEAASCPPKERFNQALAEGLRYWDKEAEDNPPLNTRAGLIKVFEAYVDFYPREPWHLIKDGGELGWIWPLEAGSQKENLRGQDLYLGGSLDGYIEWPGYGTLVLENKTSGSYLSDLYISQWAYAAQITNYIWYLSQLVGKKAFGCLVNMATKVLPGPKANWKTPRFTRSLETRTPKALRDFEQQVIETISRARHYWDNWNWPKTLNHTMCSGGPGISACKMRRICLLDEPYQELEPPLMFDYLEYRKQAWKPWERVGEQT